MIKNRIVTTYNGAKVNRTDCVRIKDIDGKFKFWIKNVECVRYNDTWFKSTHEDVKVNHSTGKIFHIDQRSNLNIVEGYVNTKLEKGYFTNDPYQMVYIAIDIESSRIKCINKDIPEALGYTESLSENTWYKRLSKSNNSIGNDDTYTIPLTYGAGEVLHLYQGYEKPITPNETDIKLSSLLGDYSFGFEFENAGFIPLWELRDLGLIPLRDGSIGSGVEYATTVLKGTKGIANLRRIIKTLHKRTRPITDGSMHIHIGNINTEPKSLLALYKLVFKVQDELYAMFPAYKKDGAVKHRRGSGNGYSDPIPSCGTTPKIGVSNFSAKLGNVINFLSDGNEESYTGDKRTHPKDPNGNRKWNINSRYTGVNFVNMVYSGARTIEFRLHSSTTSYDKIINWLLISTAIVKFAESNQNAILSNDTEFTLYNIIHSSYPYSVAKNLMDYYSARVRYYREYDITNDPLCSNELKTDKDFKHSIL